MINQFGRKKTKKGLTVFRSQQFFGFELTVGVLPRMQQATAGLYETMCRPCV